MIQRLVTTLRALADLPAGANATDDVDRLAADCADALRLELDCPQQELTAGQRRSLVALGGALESPHDVDRLRVAAGAAYRTLGIGGAGNG
jgi:hypothetical protein